MKSLAPAIQAPHLAVTLETLLAQAKLHSNLLIWVLPVKLYCEMENPGNFTAR